MGDKCVNPSVKSSGKSEIKESQDVIPLDESICIPVVSNTILIKNCQVKVLGDAFTPWSDEAIVDAEECGEGGENKAAPQSGDVVQAVQVCGSEMIDLDEYFSSVSSSDEAEVMPIPSVQDVPTLPATLRLLEEVSLRILGEKTVSVPKIEIIITCPTPENEPAEEELEIESKSPDEEVEEESTEDNEYLDAVKYSELLVNGILQSAKQVCRYKHEKNVVLVGFSEGVKFQNIVWPTIEHFSVKAGVESIDKYIYCAFNLEEAWKYKVTFLIGQSDRASDFYLYDAKFCIPTCCYPIAQATVSVFFTIEVSRVIPKNVPVRATFTIESLRTVMTPGEVEINDEMLLRVLYAKLEIFKQVRF